MQVTFQIEAGAPVVLLNIYCWDSSQKTAFHKMAGRQTSLLFSCRSASLSSPPSRIINNQQVLLLHRKNSSFPTFWTASTYLAICYQKTYHVVIVVIQERKFQSKEYQNGWTNLLSWTNESKRKDPNCPDYLHLKYSVWPVARVPAHITHSQP